MLKNRLSIIIIILLALATGCIHRAKVNRENSTETSILNGFEVKDLIYAVFNYNIIRIMDLDSNYYVLVSEQNRDCQLLPGKKIELEVGKKYDIPLKIAKFTDQDKIYSGVYKHMGDRFYLTDPRFDFYKDNEVSNDLYFSNSICHFYLILGD